jgi:ribonuclease BN (tRNA processing enzyme)
LQVTVLGTAPPLKTLLAGQGGTSLLVRSDDACLLVDCGPGAVNRLDTVGVDVRMVSALLLTHHHWDHVGDVPFLVLGRWEASQFGASGGRPFADPLTVLGPRGTVRLLERFFGKDGAYAGDIATRLAADIGVPLYGTRGIPAPFPPVMPDAADVDPGDRSRIGCFDVEAGHAMHCQPYLASVAWRITAADRTIVFSGDSAPCDDVVRLATGADLLLHDCNLKAEVRQGLGRVALHSTAEEVGRAAAAAGVPHVVAVHHGLADDDAAGRDALAARIAGPFGGRVTVARTGSVFDLRHRAEAAP